MNNYGFNLLEKKRREVFRKHLILSCIVITLPSTLLAGGLYLEKKYEVKEAKTDRTRGFARDPYNPGHRIRVYVA